MHRIRGLDLQRREASALWVIEQVRDLARGAPAHLRHHPVRIVCPRRLPRGERYRRGFPRAASPTSRSNRSATLRKSSPNWSGARTRSSPGTG